MDDTSQRNPSSSRGAETPRAPDLQAESWPESRAPNLQAAPTPEPRDPERHGASEPEPREPKLLAESGPEPRDPKLLAESGPEPREPDVQAASLPEPGHVSVMLEPVLAALRPHGGVGFHALDCTVGAGGHSFGLLERSSPDGQLVGLDADPRALAVAATRLAPFGNRCSLLNRNFGNLADLDLHPMDAVVFDLGLSSMQLESSGRGFSFRQDEPLDMRFDTAGDSPTAADLLNSLPEGELERLLREYGEEPRARRVARTIVQRRAAQPFSRTGDLVAAVSAALGPARGRIHPATRTFQAMRIAVNDELRMLEAGLQAAVRLLAPGGRIAVISFHSLEDRIVKWRFRQWAEQGDLELTILTRKPLVPDPDEVRLNPRARSAKLRVAERTP